jgi:hypothetical protein
MTFGPANSQSAYLPPEQDFPEDEDLFREILAERERLTATILNVKENAQYEKVELLSGQQWFSQTVDMAIVTSYIFRLTFDLVALNGGVPIPPGITTRDLVLLVNPQPSPINIPTAIQPVHGFGAANNGINFYFINDPLVFVRTNIWTNASQQIIITNNSGAPLTQCVWVMEYIKT